MEAHVLLDEVSINPTIETRLQDWAASDQTTNKEGAQPHESVENWNKDFLKPVHQSQSLPLGSLHKPLMHIHQRAERRSKNYNPMASTTKIKIPEN